ncbi:MAG: bifunctional phosphopantothenoylcysteine decarboxylase/phosphopantothenate--cysteine ligase CoaBC [Candidatus Thorarchaeota archaeon]|nr:MAG: bifunctional phosphopantothenoylcysteine decarboxylase/phosphopantothenate--cysteine ligase CoaBC [Candidatus Thorarchaeota archaeon]
MTNIDIHTSKLIIGSKSSLLGGRLVALCVTGSVAAVDCVAIARGIMRHGAEVHCVMSRMAQKIIHPYLLEWATGNPVVTELTGKIEHVTLAGKHEGRVDLVLVAPSTANTIGKIANGIDDTTVTTTVSSAIGARIPVVIVPAMHESLYDHPAVNENIEKLRRMGVIVLAPRMEEAKAKIPKTNTIIDEVLAVLGPKDLDGKRFVVTAGPNRAWIDTVRFVSNPSTGKMGIAITEELLGRGAEVTLVIGPTVQELPERATTKSVETAQQMLEVVMDSVTNECDAFISSAAVLDYVPAKKEPGKISSGDKSLTLELVPTKKIIDEVRKAHNKMYIVGFKVESGVTDDELESRARTKIDSGVCDIVIANDSERAGVAFAGETNEVLIVGKTGIIDRVTLTTKREVARRIVNVLASELQQQK